MRAKHDPAKWPILDKKGKKEEEIISQLVPPPPMPKTLRERQQQHTDNLNPDVAEFIPNNGENDDNNNDENGGGENWLQVKRKNKENKIKKETKVKSVEREDLEFHFDEELDQEVPTGRQNTFSNEWYKIANEMFN